ncbi:MAG: hypothetical protein M1825_003585 [Sarcosagium campestre]|nr:MAG: hypothetical protein M1825_003585 [Sarcosagium campestre]
MTVDENLYETTESLILSTPPIYYPAKIPFRHWQLRHLISCPYDNTLYYASDSDIYCLHTVTKKRELVTTLPFAPRCLAADHDWLCLGGAENGQFAAIKISKEPRSEGEGATLRIQVDALLADSSDTTRGQSEDVDALLPLDLDPSLRHETSRFLAARNRARARIQRKYVDLRIEEFGGLITNSVTIHKYSGHDCHSDGVVAVLTNNDKTVRVYSVTQGRLLATLEYPCAMNHASISPDGQLLVAVGDDPFAYFHKHDCANSSGPSNTGADSDDSSVSVWQCLQRYHLTAAADPKNDGCFSTAFSHSGKYCAVASQDGVFTIFATQHVGNGGEDAIISVMPSSRPRFRMGAGAIRSLCFSPEPWDLLVCTEHSGRICVTDTRSGFRSRQVVTLTNSPDAVELADIAEDWSAEEPIDPRLRDSPDPGALRSLRHGTDSPFVAGDFPVGSRERASLMTASPEENPNQPFTEHERQILDALRASRERIEAREQRPISVNYRASGGADVPELSSASIMTADEYLGVTANLGGPTTVTYAPTLRDYIRERNAERDTARTRAFEPRRRGSMFVTSWEPPRQQFFDGADAARAVREAASRVPAGEQGASAAAGGATDEGSSPWHTIEAAMASGLQAETGSRLRRERDRDALTSNIRRDQEARIRQDLHGRDQLRLLAMERSGGLGTTGCAMSTDGRKLYVGTEEGILEYQVNIQSRKYFPRIDPR